MPCTQLLGFAAGLAPSRWPQPCPAALPLHCCPTLAAGRCARAAPSCLRRIPTSPVLQEQAKMLEAAGGWDGLANLTVCVPGGWGHLVPQRGALHRPALSAPAPSARLPHSPLRLPCCRTEGYYATEALQRQYGVNIIETKLEQAVDAVKGDTIACTALAYDSGAARARAQVGGSAACRQLCIPGATLRPTGCRPALLPAGQPQFAKLGLPEAAGIAPVLTTRCEREGRGVAADAAHGIPCYWREGRCRSPLQPAVRRSPTCRLALPVLQMPFPSRRATMLCGGGFRRRW